MRTEIFENKEAFDKRPNKFTNGVSPEFAKKYPNYGFDNDSNVGCWNCNDCKHCAYSQFLDDCYDCENCKDCINCWACSGSVGLKDLTW
ncbi:MAG: hypothetical protein ACRCZB_07645 [Bacteroidales bacterium]